MTLMIDRAHTSLAHVSDGSEGEGHNVFVTIVHNELHQLGHCSHICNLRADVLYTRMRR